MVQGSYHAVLLLGAPGCGKSDLLLRLIDRGFVLVADDQVVVEDGVATAPEALAGILEVRGLGLFRLPFVTAPLRLVARLDRRSARLPESELHPELRLPIMALDPAAASAAARVVIGLDGAIGNIPQVAGIFGT